MRNEERKEKNYRSKRNKGEGEEEGTSMMIEGRRWKKEEKEEKIDMEVIWQKKMEVEG